MFSNLLMWTYQWCSFMGGCMQNTHMWPRAVFSFCPGTRWAKGVAHFWENVMTEHWVQHHPTSQEKITPVWANGWLRSTQESWVVLFQLYVPEHIPLYVPESFRISYIWVSQKQEALASMQKALAPRLAWAREALAVALQWCGGLQFLAPPWWPSWTGHTLLGTCLLETSNCSNQFENNIEILTILLLSEAIRNRIRNINYLTCTKYIRAHVSESA